MLSGVEALTMSNVKSGNIIFDLQFTGGEDLTSNQIATVYELAPQGADEQLADLLNSAKLKGLSLFEMNSSYGAGCRALFKESSLADGYTVAQTNSVTRLIG